jgi:hypothetical protein
MKIKATITIHDEYLTVDVPDEEDEDMIEEMIRIEFFNYIRECPTCLSVNVDW